VKDRDRSWDRTLYNGTVSDPHTGAAEDREEEHITWGGLCGCAL